MVKHIQFKFRHVIPLWIINRTKKFPSPTILDLRQRYASGFYERDFQKPTFFTIKCIGRQQNITKINETDVYSQFAGPTMQSVVTGQVNRLLAKY